MIKIGLVSYYSEHSKYPNKYSLGTLRIASKLFMLENLTIKIIPVDCDNFNIDDYKDDFEELNVVGFGLYSWTIDISLKLRKTYIKSETLVILGGPSVNNIEVELLEGNETIVFGEGEQQVYDIVKNKYKLKEKVREKYEPNEDELLFSNEANNTYPLYDEDFITQVGLTDTNKFSWFETSRGCPYNCAFCGHKTRKDVFTFPLEFSKKEIINIGKNKIAKVFIVDPVLGGNKKHGQEILKLFSKYSPHSQLIIYLRTELLDSEYLDIISQSNINEIRIGIQTLNPNVPNYIRSNSLKAIYQYLPYLSKEMIPWRAELIIGLPGDTFIGFINTLKQVINEIHPTYLCAYRLTIIKGTKIYDLLKNNNVKKDLWIEKDKKNRVIASSTFCKEDLNKMIVFGNAITSLYNGNVFYYKGKVINTTGSFDFLYELVDTILTDVDFKNDEAIEKYTYSYFNKFWKKTNRELDK